MYRAMKITAVVTALTIAPVTVAQSIATDAQDQTLATAFASDNAILDTRLLFAKGARESQQNLRGAFGWPTFQEGLVESVYFRFDPDGYARFSPSPRLDEDVFEVVCRPRTYTCMAQKDGMYLLLTGTGQIHLHLDNVQTTDQLMLSDGTTELALPARVLEPLEIQFERLLSTGGTLVVRRGENTVSEVSLKGFSAVSAYLRWISARQDYTVLPTGWPVPNSRNDQALQQVTQAEGWVNPMPQPRTIGQVSQGAAYADGTATLATSDMQELRGELAELRDLLRIRTNASAMDLSAPAVTPDPTQNRLQDLEAMIQSLKSDLDGMVAPAPAPVAGQPLQPMATQPMYPTIAAQSPWRADTSTSTASDPMPAEALPDEVRHLQYLVAQMGLDAKTALVLMQFIKPEDNATTPPVQARSYHDTLAQSILEDLEADLAASAQAIGTQPNVVLTEDKKTHAAQMQGIQEDGLELGAIATNADLASFDMPTTLQDGLMHDTPNDAAHTPTTSLDEPTDFQPLSDYFNVVLNRQ